MIELSAVLVVMSLIFGLLGYYRGWGRELIATSGVVLALFALDEFDQLLRGTLLAGVTPDQRFFVQAAIFVGVVFFAYQSRSFFGTELQRASQGRDATQNSVLGALLGAVNGYMIWGSLWYFMAQNGYPFAPLISQPVPGSPSDQVTSLLPLVLLGGGAAGNGDILAAAVIVLFVIVLYVI
jgi:uncharacterized membrane protein required for colicin V production